jgi:hypothetical protein
MAAASALPSGMPQYIKPTMVLRWRIGVDSNTSATRFGIAAPRPTPVSARATSIGT